MSTRPKGRNDLRTSRSALHRAAGWNKGEAAAEERRRRACQKGAKAKATISDLKKIVADIWAKLCSSSTIPKKE